MSGKDKSTPMDATIREERVGTPAVNRQRVCWAAKTLVAEVDELYPEIPVEYSNHDGRNTALDVTFDLTVLDSTDSDMLVTLLELTSSDSRIAYVIVGDEDVVLVSFEGNPRTQDSRDPFGLSDALGVLTEGDDMFDGMDTL